MPTRYLESVGCESNFFEKPLTPEMEIGSVYLFGLAERFSTSITVLHNALPSHADVADMIQKVEAKIPEVERALEMNKLAIIKPMVYRCALNLLTREPGQEDLNHEVWDEFQRRYGW